MKTHPLTKLQLLIGIIWVTGLFGANLPEKVISQLLLLISHLAFLVLGLNTFYLGWLMVFQKEIVIYPPESFWFNFSRRWRSQQAAAKLKVAYQARSRQKGVGWLNLITGALCASFGMLAFFYL